MKKTLLIILSIITISFTACNSNDDEQGSNDSLTGTWATSFSEEGFSFSETLTFTATTFLVVGTETEDGETSNYRIEGTYQLDGESITASFTEEKQMQTNTGIYYIDEDKLTLKWDDNDTSDIYTRQ